MKTFCTLAIQNAHYDDSDQTANAQADLNLGWAQISEGTFTDVEAFIKLSDENLLSVKKTTPLTFTILCANSADDRLKTFVLFLLKKPQS